MWCDPQESTCELRVGLGDVVPCPMPASGPPVRRSDPHRADGSYRQKGIGLREQAETLPPFDDFGQSAYGLSADGEGEFSLFAVQRTDLLRDDSGQSRIVQIDHDMRTDDPPDLCDRIAFRDAHSVVEAITMLFEPDLHQLEQQLLFRGDMRVDRTRLLIECVGDVAHRYGVVSPFPEKL